MDFLEKDLDRFISSQSNDYKFCEIPLSEILKHKIETHCKSNYLNGGWYMILNTENGMAYIGKSVNYKNRLKNHVMLANSKKGLFIDLEMHGKIDLFKFYLIESYQKFSIGYHSRKLEMIYEKKLIKEFNTLSPYGYNQRKEYYG